MLKKCIFATTILLVLMFGAFVVRASTASAIDQKPTPAMVTQIASSTMQNPAEFTVISLTVDPVRPFAGGPVNVIATVGNTGGSSGQYAANLKINNVSEATQNIFIPAGGTGTLSFIVSREKAGIYEAALDERTGQFWVVTSLSPSQLNTSNPSSSSASCCQPTTSGSNGSSNPTNSGSGCCQPPASIPSSAPRTTTKSGCCG